MKKIILTLCFTISFTISIFGQTEVDEYVSINIPGNVIKLDTIAQRLHVLNFHSENETETYLIQRIEIDSKESELNGLPYDLNSLKKTYQDIIRGQLKGMEKTDFSFKDSTEIKIDKFIGYKIRYNNSDTGMQNAESNILILNEYAYVAIYVNGTDFNDINKNKFLNSLKVNEANNPRQMIGNPSGFKVGYILGKLFFYGLLIFGVIFLIKKLRKK